MPARRQNVEGSLYQRASDGRWVAVVHLGWKDGKRQRRVFTGKTSQDAYNRRARWLELRRDGFTLPKGRQPYVSEWLLHWLDNVARRKIEATTYDKGYRQKVTEHIAPYFERILLAELTEEDIEHWHAQLEEVVSKRTGRPLSPSTISQCHRIMSTAIKAGVARGRLPRNPLQNVTPPQPARKELDLPSKADVDRILLRCKTWPNGARWVVALRTGLRQGEALALRWSDLNLGSPATVTVRRAAARVSGGELTYKSPKSQKSRRTIPLAASAVEALKLHKQRQAVASLDGLVFTDAKGQPVHPRQDYADWHELLDDLGLPRHKVHTCRHTVATSLLEAGVDPRTVQDLMGWSSLAMTEIYQHVRPAAMQAAIEALDS